MVARDYKPPQVLPSRCLGKRMVTCPCQRGSQESQTTEAPSMFMAQHSLALTTRSLQYIVSGRRMVKVVMAVAFSCLRRTLTTGNATRSMVARFLSNVRSSSLTLHRRSWEPICGASKTLLYPMICQQTKLIPSTGCGVRISRSLCSDIHLLTCYRLANNARYSRFS